MLEKPKWTTQSFVDLLIKHHADVDIKSPNFFMKRYTKILFAEHQRYLIRTEASEAKTPEEQKNFEAKLKRFETPKDRKTWERWYEQGIPCDRFSPIYTRYGFRIRNLLTADWDEFCVDFYWSDLMKDLIKLMEDDPDPRVKTLIAQAQSEDENERIDFNEFLMRAFLLTIRVHGYTGGKNDKHK